MKAFVTGATGVVGGSLVRHLLAEGDTVTVYSRRAAELPGVATVRGSLFSQHSLAEAMSGHDVVFHVAGVNELCSRDVRAMYEVNVDAARTVARAASTARVPRLVHTSSVAADAADPPSHYARSKQLGERAVLAESGTEIVAVRPASVQGPGRITGSTKVIVDIVTGRLRYAVDTTVSVVDIEDCARGHRAAAVRGRPGAVYTLSGFTLSISEALESLGQLLGRELTVRMLPIELLTAAAPIAGLSRLWGGSPLLCPELVRTLRADHAYDGRPAAEELGFEYRTAEDTLQRLLDWLTRTGTIA